MKTKEKVLATVTLMQPGIATGYDQSEKTVLHLVDGVWPGNHAALAPDGYELSDGEREMGIVEIVHPAIMAGDIDEVLNAMYHAAEWKLVGLGIVYLNDFGVCFLNKKKAAR